MNKVLDVMLKDHLRLLTLLTQFEREDIENLDLKYSKFKDLEWNLEKHFFIEEKVIFLYLTPNISTVREENLYIELAKQHTRIKNQLKEVEKDIKNKIKPNVLEIRDLLIGHQKYEEKLIYPKLDENLNEQQKNIIFEKISEIINLEYF